ncbi:MAG: hypothetical protein GY821_01845 [Gammaproteobacteria bacterium]|nr:hypothetical protein [Gammaproteobacteria bacterium]
MKNIRVRPPLANTKLAAGELKEFVRSLKKVKNEIIQLNQKIDNAKSVLSNAKSTPQAISHAMNDIKHFSVEQRKLNKLLKDYNHKLHYYLREIKLSQYGAKYDDLVEQSIDSSCLDKDLHKRNNLYHEYENNGELKENINLLCNAKDIINESDSIMGCCCKIMCNNFLDMVS